MAANEGAAAASPATSSSSLSSSIQPTPLQQPPKILLARADSASATASVSASATATTATADAPSVKMMRPRNSSSSSSIIISDDANANSHHTRSGRLSHHLVSDTWDFHADRVLDRLSDSNTDFTVIGIIGTTGAGKSTIMNELYGMDANATSQGMLPPFPVQTEETRSVARHCTVGIELRTSVERLILLDTQPVFSPSILAEMMRPDGSSTIPVLGGENISAELAHELMGIQLGVFLASVCHVLLVVTEGVQDICLWKLMSTVDMLKQGIPDPSLLNSSTSVASYPQGSSPAADKDDPECLQDDSTEFFADPVFIHTKLLEHECSRYTLMCLDKALSLYFDTASFRKIGAVKYLPSQLVLDDNWKTVKGGYHDHEDKVENDHSFDSACRRSDDVSPKGFSTSKVNFFVLPVKAVDESSVIQHESYNAMLAQLRDQVLSIPKRSFARAISERDWLRNAARIWDTLKKSAVIADYGRTLQGSGLYRR